MEYQLLYIIVITCNILNGLSFGQVLLIENEPEVSQNNRAIYSGNDDFYVAYEPRDLRTNNNNESNGIDALVDLLYDLGSKSKNNFIWSEKNYGNKKQDHVTGNRIYLHKGDVIMHSNVNSKAHTKKQSAKDSGLGLDLDVDDVVKLAAELYEKVMKLNEIGKTKIDGINIHNTGQHQDANNQHDHDHNHDHGYDHSHDHKHEHVHSQGHKHDPGHKYNEDDSTWESEEQKGKGDAENNQNNGNEMSEIDFKTLINQIVLDSLFQEITASTSTILDLANKANGNGCPKIEISAKSIAAIAEKKCTENNH